MWTQRQITDKQVNACQYLQRFNICYTYFQFMRDKKLIYMKVGILPESYCQKAPNPVNIGKLKMIHKLPQCCYVEVSC